MKHPIFLLLLIAGGLRAEIGIVAHPGVDCSPGSTTVWTGAMQAAFDRMLGAKSSMTLDRVEPPNPLVTKMAGFSWKEVEVLPKDGWFAVTGEASEKLTDEANQKWQVLAGSGPMPFKYNGSVGGRSAYVGMKRVSFSSWPSVPREPRGCHGVRKRSRFDSSESGGMSRATIPGVSGFSPTDRLSAAWLCNCSRRWAMTPSCFTNRRKLSR